MFLNHLEIIRDVCILMIPVTLPLVVEFPWQGKKHEAYAQVQTVNYYLGGGEKHTVVKLSCCPNFVLIGYF